jgi:hypothetical protein
MTDEPEVFLGSIFPIRAEPKWVRFVTEPWVPACSTRKWSRKEGRFCVGSPFEISLYDNSGFVLETSRPGLGEVV